MKMKSESEVTQSTLSDPIDCSLPGSFVHGIFQARVLEWVAIAAWQIEGDNVEVMTDFLLLGYLPVPRIEVGSSVFQADSLLCEPPGKPICYHTWNI